MHRYSGYLWLLQLMIGCAPHRPALIKGAAVPNQNKFIPENKSISPDVPSGEAAQRDEQIRAQASPLVEAFVNIQGRVTPDGRRLVFVSNRGGHPQLYLSDTQNPTAEPRQLTNITEQVDSPVPTPDSKAVLFRSDKGANEHWSIFRINLDGTGLQELTPGADLSRDTPIIPRGLAERIYYSARIPSAGSTTIYWQSAVEPTPPVAIYTDPSPGELFCTSHDGRWGIFVRQVSLDDGHVLAIDMVSKTARHIYPPDGVKAGVFSLACTEDASKIYIASDGGGEDGLVIGLDRASAKEIGRYRETKPSTARIQDVTVSPKGNLLGINVNLGSQTQVKILDQKSLKLVATAKLPLGMGFLGNFTDDGKTLAVEWATPSTPNDMFALDSATGQAVSLRQEVRPGLSNLAPIDVHVAEVSSFDGLKVPVNVYLPKGAEAGGKQLPVIVYVHGGPAANAVIRWKAQFRFLLSQGYAIVEPNVRGSTGFGRSYAMADDGCHRLDAVRDLEQVALWVRQQPWADRDRLVAMGLSYGGYMVLMALTRQQKLWRAGIDIYGIANLRTLLTSTTGFIREVFKAEFGDLEKDGAFLDSISPIHDADKITAPLFVYAGANDSRVPRSESDQIVAAVRARQGIVEYMVAENEGHSMTQRQNQLAFIARVARFLEKHLR